MLDTGLCFRTPVTPVLFVLEIDMLTHPHPNLPPSRGKEILSPLMGEVREGVYITFPKSRVLLRPRFICYIE